MQDDDRIASAICSRPGEVPLPNGETSDHQRKDSSQQGGKPASLGLSKLKAYLSILHIPSGNGDLSRWLMCCNSPFMAPNVTHHLDSLEERLITTSSSSSSSLSFSFLRLMKKKEVSMAAQQKKKKLKFRNKGFRWRQRRWFPSVDLSLFIDGWEATPPSIQTTNPWKVGQHPEIYSQQ